MKLTRRDALGLTAAALAGSTACRGAGTAAAMPAGPQTGSASAALPDLQNFSLGRTVYLNAGSQHPISKPARASIEAYLDHRAHMAPNDAYDLGSDAAIEKFARLVNADPDEVTWVQSTTAGEQMIVRSLGLPEQGAKVVTDTLHFFGSFPLYGELERQGCEVAWVEAKDGRISLEDMDRAITPGTRLVSLSLVSTINGFEHDLKAVCDLAHSRGALVYADIIHAAGCVPVDLHASGVDFAATASYKWLMGDFGLGFLYVRKGVMDQLRRTNYGYYGISQFATHMYPHDAPGDELVEYSFADNASGWFALGTHSHTVIAQLNASLDYILDLGVETIQAHAQALTSRLKEGLKSQGFDLLTGDDFQTPIVTAIYEDAYKRLGPVMKERGIVTTLSRNRFRPTVSVFNTMDDVDAFLEAVGTA
ncbi:aminotransferase class V-fold PLP-dependent enzyme [Henriciella aquimarina]|uniref:aminotransferase class V-fold PLP-dependent enzyme n=1 Tax=Henriciella aquimarina TaxID=545261 RepID=UPI000A05E179|nr:aminotransferase class V-fold PLP-dependent enzyme [Henriciella aquimarina]